MRRYNVHKQGSASRFRAKAGKTKAINMRGPMRGGIRL